VKRCPWFVRITARVSGQGAGADDLEALFDFGYPFKEVDTIFRRVFGD